MSIFRNSCPGSRVSYPVGSLRRLVACGLRQCCNSGPNKELPGPSFQNPKPRTRPASNRPQQQPELGSNNGQEFSRFHALSSHIPTRPPKCDSSLKASRRKARHPCAIKNSRYRSTRVHPVSKLQANFPVAFLYACSCTGVHLYETNLTTVLPACESGNDYLEMEVSQSEHNSAAVVLVP
jgi:hypothetical protein